MIEQLIEAGRQIVVAKMARGWGGNLSGRYQGNVAITRSGADLGNLTRSDFVVVSPHAPVHQQRLPKPSSELAMHLAAYQAQPSAQAIIHAHPPQAIALGLLGMELPALTPDFYVHLGTKTPLLPYITPTTEELGTAVSELLESFSAVLLQNHGAIVIGHSVSQALLRLMLLEEQAGIYLQALAIGEPRLLSEEDMLKLDVVTGGRYRQGERMP